MRRTLFTKRTCLHTADNRMLFRWMGCWCAVNAPTVRVKAEQRDESPLKHPRRRKRLAKRRGRVSTHRRRVERASHRRAPQIPEASTPQTNEKSIRRLSRAKKRDQRMGRVISRSLLTIAKLGAEMKELGDTLEKGRLSYSNGKVSRNSMIATTYDFIDNLALSKFRGASRCVARLIPICMGYWGLPRDATLTRLKFVGEMVGDEDSDLGDLPWKTIPRVKHDQLLALKAFWSSYSSVNRPYGGGIGTYPPPDGLYTSAPSVRGRTNRPREGNHEPVRVCRACGYVGRGPHAFGECRRAPTRGLRGAKAKPRTGRGRH